ncbi:MAG: hypothetical protein HYZ27_06560, partial [Deltaproteobacteria bacterium]|nr:hypothetical protein [Deltaproteobacteria bacterium]
VVCLDSGCGNYEQLWATSSLRGLIGGELSVSLLREGVHSGDGSGVVCSLEDAQDVCDGVDNNCNGTVDEPFPQVGQVCYVPEAACTRPGSFQCSSDGSQAECVPDMSQPLQCCPNGQVQNSSGACCSPLPVGACTYSCTVDVVAGTHDCAGPVTSITLAPGSGIATLDMSGRAGVELAISLCDPTGFTFHVADSPTCNGGGGDASTFNNDAEAHFNNQGDFYVIGNDYSPATARVLATLPGFAPAGCSTNTFWVADQRFLSFEPCVDLTSPYLLRINPPADAEGPPDALWYLGFNQVHDGIYRPGTGLGQVSLCFR